MKMMVQTVKQAIKQTATVNPPKKNIKKICNADGPTQQ